MRKNLKKIQTKQNTSNDINCFVGGVQYQSFWIEKMLKREWGSATPVGGCQNQGVKRCQMATLVMTVSVSKIYVLRDILCLSYSRSSRVMWYILYCIKHTVSLHK